MKQKMPNFDTLLDLALNDPEQLEEIRSQLAMKTINSAPESVRQRLRGLQFQIDTTCKLSKTPLAACIRLSEMMHNSLEELRQAVQRPQQTTALANPNASLNAKILNFPTP
ncbi:MAG: DUF3135 domain-containing protein [Oceanicoccus sp.]|uniref:DUF3135 domain-containing protein n=1 Tax=Oceanicoccus sp. TaxID=2691044 RepID=UPI0026157B2B|nr:DUF3135 domain-containing protein [Oceanicoccus sp.]MCP3908189.1 DUF3135 domain-containing protein [Oceanicoccus sp.]MDG1772064.1 DUF3135 domain-containing protein [Oceanicoccus sp.]